MNSSFVRKNGLMYPYHPLQIVSWILTSAHFTIGCLIICPLLELQNVMVFAVIFYSSQILVVVFAYKATKCDPTDHVIYEQRIAKQQG